MLQATKPFILASNSPRRQAFFKELGLDFSILLPTIPTDEALDSTKSPIENVQAIAKEKAYALIEEHKSACIGKIVVSADTIVVLDNDEILNKPENTLEAFNMLKKLNNARHRVITAICMLEIEEESLVENILYDISNVYFAHWKDEILLQYAESGEGLDKAGAYGIQGKGAFLVEKIEGSWATVVGFPMHAFIQKLDENHLLL